MVQYPASAKNSPAACGYADNSYQRPYTKDERLASLAFLGADRSSTAVNQLCEYLNDKNMLISKNQMQPQDDSIVRAIIINMGRTGSPKAAMLLQAVGGLGYSNPIKQLAQQAIKNIRQTNPQAKKSAHEEND
jgi:hypothetical protein